MRLGETVIAKQLTDTQKQFERKLSLWKAGEPLEELAGHHRFASGFRVGEDIFN